MTEPYIHPLAETTDFLDQNEEQQEGINSWGFASMMANVLAKRTEGDDSKIIGYVRQLISENTLHSNPDKLIEKAKTDDKAIALLISILAEDFDEKMANTFDVER